MGRKPTQNDADDPLDRDDDTIEFVPAGSLPPPQPTMTAQTDAERKTEDLWERMLGVDDAGTGYVAIHRVVGGAGSSEEFVEKIPSDRFGYEDLLEYLRETYGPGDYRIRLYVKNGRGNFVLRGNRMAPIARRISNAMPAIREGGRQGQEMTAVLATFEAMQQRSQQQMAELIDRIERRNSAPSRSPALEMAETMQAMMTAMAPMFALLKGGNAQAPQTDPLDMLTKIMALQRQLQPPVVEREETGAGMMDVVKAGLTALPAILNARNDGARRALPQPPPQPTPRKPLAPTFDPVETAPPAGVASAEAGEEGIRPAQPPMGVDRNKGNRLHPLHDNLCSLLDAAIAWEGADESTPEDEIPTPERVAQVMVDNMDEGQRPLFRQFLESRTLVRDLVAIHPDAIDHTEWLLDLRDEVIDRLDLIDGVNRGYDQDSSPLDPDSADNDGQQNQEDRPPQTA